VGERLAELLPLSPASKQRLLEMDDVAARIEVLRRLIRPGAAD
jgi:Lon protease-like protein